MAKDIEVRDGLLYSRDHLWVLIEGGKARFGLTDYAQMEMGDLVYLELTEVGKNVGIDESEKTIDSIYARASGKVIESNPAVEKEPKLANQAPYDHWIGVIEMSSPSDVEALQDSAGYRKKV